MNPDLVGNFRIVWQVPALPDGADSTSKLLRQLDNLLTDLGEEHVTVDVVAYSHGLSLLVAGDPSCAPPHTALEHPGVRYLACENSLRSRGLGTDDLVPGVLTVPSGVGHLVRRQHQGWNLLIA